MSKKLPFGTLVGPSYLLIESKTVAGGSCGVLACSMYKGVTLSGAVVVPYLAVSFSVYDHLRAQLPEDRQSRGAWWQPARQGRHGRHGRRRRAGKPAP